MKELVLGILRYMTWRIENNGCTAEELRQAYKVLTEEMDVSATVSDMAEYYGQSESNVRNVLSRHYVGKPKRRVYYNMGKVARAIPKSWNRTDKGNGI